jgi:outer membrane protein assembly factor BamB
MNSQTFLPPRSRRVMNVVLLCVALLLSIVVALAQTRPRSSAQTPASDAQEVETTFHWEAQAGVSRYRLQVSLDPRFTDIIYDGAINGLEQKVPLAPGRYYWRVAPAPKETGRFSPPIKIDVPGSGATIAPTPTPITRPTPILVTRPTPLPITRPTHAAITRPTPTPTVRPTPAPVEPVAPKLLRPPANAGWETGMGSVDRVIAVRLRVGQSADFVAVNSDGTVYALEGETGAALWTARFVPGRQASGATAGAAGVVFAPIATRASSGDTANVLVGFDGGVRLLEGETGRELWRAALKGRATGGCAADLDGDETTTEIAVTTDDQQFYVFNSTSGALLSQTKLDNEVVGLPIPFQNGAERGVALTLKGAQVEVRKADGKRLRGVKFDVPFITPPLVIAGPRGTLVVVGSEHGLLFMDGAMKPLGRVTTEGESPRGRLAAADLNGDGVFEIVMVTNHDRVVVVSGDGKIVWSAQGARDAYTPVFADLNGDGFLDVLAADSGVFARGFSGRDGTVIWQADDEKPNATQAADEQSHTLRSLAVASGVANAAPLLASGDHSRGALRAIGLPIGSVRVAVK